MIKKSVCFVSTLACLISPLAARAQEFAMVTPSAAPLPAPSAIAPLDKMRIEGITKTVMAYPSQTPAILENYIGLDISKIDFDQFMPLVERGNVQEIQNEITTLYTNREAFNNGTFTNVSYYKANSVVQPANTVEAPTDIVDAPVETAQAAQAPVVTDETMVVVDETAPPAPAADTTAAASTSTSATTETTVASSTASTSSKIVSAIVDTNAGAVVTGTVITGGLIAGAAAASVAGGSGGGSGGSNGSGSDDDYFNRAMLPDLQPASTYLDTEFGSFPLNALEFENAHYAYAKGLSGAGVTIGFHDFFTDDSSSDPELNSRIVYRNLNISADTVFLNPGCTADPTDEAACNHGGVVMARAGDARDNSGTMGVAYGANLMMNSVFAGVTGARTLADNGADIINFSCGGCATQADLQYIAGLGILMTSATGNSPDLGDGDVNPNPSSPASYASQLDYSLIAVTGAYAVGGVLTTFGYDKCGNQMEYCMTALTPNGTSFAAPQIAGAAALVKEGWSYLTPKQVSLILLNSARDVGAAGVDAIYGHGVLDLKAAMEPIGTVTAMSGGGLSNYSSSIISQNQRTAFGDAFSAPGNAKGNVVVVDSYGRDFNVTTQNNLAVAREDKFSADRMFALGRPQAKLQTINLTDGLSLQYSRQQNELDSNDMVSFAEYEVSPATKMKLGFTTDMGTVVHNDLQKFNRFNFISQDSFQNGYLNFSDNDQVFNQAVELKPSQDTKVTFSNYYSKNSDADYFKPISNQVKNNFASSVVDTQYAPRDDLTFNIRNGVTHEFDSLLGTKFTGSFEMDGGADTYFTGVDVSYDVAPNWNIFGSYTFGNTQVKPSSRSAFTDISDLTSDSFNIAATRSELLGHDSLTVAVGQPTRVRSGTATGVTQSVDHTTGDVSVASFQQSLVPTGRNLQFQAAYQKELSDDIDMNVALEYETNPYQQADADAEVSGIAKMIYKWN